MDRKCVALGFDATYRFCRREKFNLAMIIAMLSSACLTCGVGLAALSMRDALRAPMLERWSGLCLLAGLVLLGAGLPFFR